MPESMFGRPLQHLLPSHPPADSRASPTKPDPNATSVAPLDFKDVRFNSIGKQPELLSRISLSQSEYMDYHSPSPSPTSTPTLNPTNIRSQTSRPTLFQRLAGNDSNVVDRGSRSASKSNGSLASRIQANASPLSDTLNTVGPPTNSSLPLLRANTVRLANEDANLIPPVEVLPQPSDSSSPPTSSSSALILEPETVHGPTSSTALINVTSTHVSTPMVASTNAVSKELTEPSPSFQVVDDIVRNLEPASSAISAIDSLVARRERLQVISDNLAKLVVPPPLSSSPSPPPDPSSLTRTNDSPTPRQSRQSQSDANPAVLHRPLSTGQPPSRAGLNVINIPTDGNDFSSAFAPTLAPFTQEYRAQRRALIEAAQNLNSTLDALHRVQVDGENAFADQIRAFEAHRAVYEQMKRVEVASLRQQSQELQQKREELNARESYLASLEKEGKAREDARKATTARRQEQEEERRAVEAKRVQEIQEQIDAAVKELMEVKALTQGAKRQFEQLASEAVLDDVPTEPQEGMNEEEMAAVNSHSNLLCDIKRLRQLHMTKLRELEESNHTLRRMWNEREKRQAEEAERHRIAEEELLRVRAEAERARQVQDEQRPQFEAERKCRAVANGHEHAPPLAEQHTEAHTHDLGNSSQVFEHGGYPEEVTRLQQQAVADTTRMRLTCEVDSRSPATHSMNMDTDERASTSHRTVPLPDIRTSPTGSQSTSLSSKQKNGPVSGGVVPSTPASKARPGHLSPKLSAKPSSRSSSNHVTENALSLPRESPATLLAEGGHKLPFSAQLASEFNRLSNADNNSASGQRTSYPRNPKSQIVLDATNGASQELSIGPVPDVSPTQQNVNLRHLKRSRGRVEENGSGDRSARTTTLKSEESVYPSLKREEVDDQSGQLALASTSMSLAASLPPRPAVIPPPRPWMKKRHEFVPQTDSTSSFPLESNKNSTKEVVVTAREQRGDAIPRDSPIVLAPSASIRRPVAPEVTNSLLLSSVRPETQSTETRTTMGRRPTVETDNHDPTSPWSAVGPLFQELGGEDLSRDNRRLTDEHRMPRYENSPRRPSAHSPPVVAWPTTVSPSQSYRLIDSRLPQHSSNGPRAEPMRTTSPVSGRKRPFEFSDNEHGDRARRQRGDVRIAQEHERGRIDSYRPHWDRRPDPELDEHRMAYRAPPSPPDRGRPYLLDISRAGYDNPYTRLASDPPAARWEQSYRQPQHDDAYQRYQPPVPGHNATADQYYRDDTRVGQPYEPMAERTDFQPEPPLLARMRTTQRFPTAANFRGRGRGKPNRGRNEANRGRGRGNGDTRSGPTLIERLQNGPSSLGD